VLCRSIDIESITHLRLGARTQGVDCRGQSRLTSFRRMPAPCEAGGRESGQWRT
jgi:hypothetical protein